MRPWYPTFLYGPRLTNRLEMLGYALPRSVVASLTTLEALEKVLDDHHAGHNAMPDLPEGERISRAAIINATTGGEITSSEVVNMHHSQLRNFWIMAKGDENTRIAFHRASNPRLRLPDSQPDLLVQLVDVLEATSRPRIRWLPLTSVLPWFAVILSLWPLVEALRAGGQAFELSLSISVVVVACIAAAMASIALYKHFAESWPETIIQTVRWRDLLAGRARVVIALTGALIGAAASLGGVYLATLP